MWKCNTLAFTSVLSGPTTTQVVDPLNLHRSTPHCDGPREVDLFGGGCWVETGVTVPGIKIPTVSAMPP